MLVHIHEGTTSKHAADHVFLHYYFYLLADLEKTNPIPISFRILALLKVNGTSVVKNSTDNEEQWLFRV